ncbi:hypothetical protein [Pedobacter sp. NJ-S-72]
MAKQTLNIIKNWFKTGLKPSQQQFWDTWDSFWHKDSIIPAANIENLDTRFNEKADAEALASHIKDLTAHGLNGKAGLGEDNKFTGKNTFTNNIRTPKILSDTGIDFNLDTVDKISGSSGFAGKLTFDIEDGRLSLMTTAASQDTASSPIFSGKQLTINNAGDAEIKGKLTTAELSVRTAENFYQNIKPAVVATEDTQLLLPALSGTLARAEDLPKISAGTNVEITGVYPEVIINASGGGAGSPLVPATYLELVAATSAGTLVPGQQYLMTDFQSTFVYAQHACNL